jgi:chromosome segregation ATPase
LILVEINFEKIKIEVQSIDQSNNESIQRLKTLISEMEQGIKSEVQNKNSLLQTQKDLEEEATKLQDNKHKFEAEVEALSKSVDVLKADTQKLDSELSELKLHQTSTDNEARSRKSEFDVLSAQISDIERNIADENAKITHAQNSTMTQLEELDSEIIHVKQLLAIQNNYSKILKSLLKDNYISLPHFDVCKVLTQQGVDSLDRLVMSSGVDRNTVVETLKELSVRGVLSFMPDSGNFEIIKQFEL